ncbi:C40 family peptidase [Actinomycetaceae bacterium TAE3-ERU4]|nr:C40 family peptidase [Actinomycetaceae bacterium TAE3-ERU4]
MAFLSQRKKLTAVAAAFCVATGGLIIATPAALADPDSSQTIGQGTSVASLEVQLAATRTRRENALTAASEANELYQRSRDELDAAKANLESTKKATENARTESAKARAELMQVVTAVYRDSSVSLAALAPYLEEGGLEKLETQQIFQEKFGDLAQKKLQKFQASEAVVRVLEKQASSDLKRQESATAAVKKNSEDARLKATQLGQELQNIENRREQLIAQLASLRHRSVAEERAHQENLEAEADARAEATARNRMRAEQNREDKAAAEAARNQRAIAEAKARQEENQRRAEAEAARKAEEERRKAAAAAEKAKREKDSKARAEQERRAREAATEARRQEERRRAAEAAREKARKEREAEAAREKARREREAAAEARRQEERRRAAEAEAAREKERQKAKENASLPAASGSSGAIAWARTKIGIPYLWGGDSDAGYDCSGLVQGAWRSQGVYLPHSSRRQYWSGTHVSYENAKPGDLLFWSSNGSSGGIFHVAIYTGNGRMIEAPYPGASVTETSVRYRKLMPNVVRLG